MRQGLGMFLRDFTNRSIAKGLKNRRISPAGREKYALVAIIARSRACKARKRQRTKRGQTRV
jgi:hypothetical protein